MLLSQQFRIGPVAVSPATVLAPMAGVTDTPALRKIPGSDELIRKALDVVSRGYITAKDFVNGVEPLSNLLEVMQHLMSHNGHLKTAIIP